MNRLKNYDCLHRFYRRSINKFKIPFFICLLIFILAFGTFIIDNFPFGLSLAMLAMIFPAVLFGILWMIASIRTKKHFKLLSQQQLTMINREAPFCAMCDGLIVTSQAVVGTKLGLQFVPMANVLWVYTMVMVDKLEGVIPVHKDTTLIFAGRDHKRCCFKIKNNQEAFRFIQTELLKHRLDIVFGYELGMDDIYKHDINRMIAFSQECADKRRREMGGLL